MKKIFFWSPHIDPQVATVKSVTNSLKSLIKYKDKLNLNLLNVFGEWNKFNHKDINIINISSNKNLINQKFKGFFNSRILYIRILIETYFPLKKLLNVNRPDYLVIHLVTAVPILLFIFNNFNTKLILRISGLPKLNIFRYLLWKTVSKKISFIICPTEETKKNLINREIFDPEKIICIYDPIINISDINSKKKQKLQNKYEKPYFLCIGRFTKQKNHQFILNFFSKNKKYLENKSLLLIGNGEYEKKYKLFIQDKKLETRIKLLDYKKNVLNYIYNAELIISCSLWEDPGFIMVEAAALNIPVLTSNCPSGPKEFIGKNESGFIFQTNNEESFKKELDNFLEISKKNLKTKLISAKKRSRFYTGLYNAKKFAKILNL